MKDFIERIRTAWLTSKTYKRRVSILLTTHDRNYTIDRICREFQKNAVFKEPALYHISVLGKKKLKNASDSRKPNIPANVSPEAIGEREPIIKAISEDSKESGVFIIDDYLKHLDEQDVDTLRDPVGINRQLFFDLFERTLEQQCDGQVFIFLEHSEKRELIPDVVDAEIQIIEHPYPSHEEVREIVNQELEVFTQRTKIKIDGIETFGLELSKHLSGFAYSTSSWIIRDVMVRNTESQKFDDSRKERVIQEVKARKEELIRQQLGMEVLKSALDKPIGVDHFLDYIEKRKDRICIPGQDRLKGVLFIGPPGTGKSLLAKYLSHHLKQPAVEVRLSSLMSQWLGETENLFQRLTNVLDAMAPVIVYMDEIEKMFSDEGSGSSGGASMIRATGRLLTWMNDTVAPVFIIATANNVSRMGEIGLTMTRRGRFDSLFYIGYPDVESRKKLFQYYLTKRSIALSEADFIDLADLTTFYTGADINGVVQEAIAEVGAEDQEKLRGALKVAIATQRERVNAIKEMYLANTGGVMRRLAFPAGSFENESSE